MREITLDKFLEDLPVSKAEDSAKLRPVTFWISIEDKAAYAQLQKMTCRKFGKRAREALLALIRMGHARAS